MEKKIMGKVKSFNDGKGYGFIQSGNDDYFVHFSEIKMDGFKMLHEGERVFFTPKQDRKGWQATDVTFSQ